MLYNLVSKIKEGFIFVTLILVILSLVGKNYSTSRKLHNLETVIHQKDGVLTTYRNRYDSLLVGVKATETPNKNSFKEAYKADRDSFRNEVGKNPNKIQAMLKTQVIRKDSIVITYKDSILNDTIQAKCFSYQDEWFTIASCSTANIGFVKYYSRLRLKSYTYKVRKKEPWYTPWKWGTKLETDIRSMNPKDSIVELQQVILQK